MLTRLVHSVSEAGEFQLQQASRLFGRASSAAAGWRERESFSSTTDRSVSRSRTRMDESWTDGTQASAVRLFQMFALSSKLSVLEISDALTGNRERAVSRRAVLSML